MKTFTLQIKNMVCPRCIHVVKQILTDLSIRFTEVELGYAILEADQVLDLEAVNQKLEPLDLGLVRDQNEVLVIAINKAIHDYLDNIGLLSFKFKLSEYIAQELARNYHQLSKIYSQYKGATIEQYFIQQRTEKVKEYIKQGNLNMSQIAVNVGYSSIHYLSGQFRKYTGMSLSQYKKAWEASFASSIDGQELLARIPENKGCDCGCEDCNCGKTTDSNKAKYPTTTISANSPMDQVKSPKLIPLINFRTYKVRVSA